MHLAETIQQKMATDQLHSLSDNELQSLLEQSSSSSLVIDPQDKHYTTVDLISDLITKDIVSRKQKRDLLKVLISDKYLFKNIDTPLSNDVFKRVFALRLIETLIKNDDQLIGFLLSDQIDLISVSLITYLNRETDYRGYLFSDNNAWLQTFTHSKCDYDNYQTPASFNRYKDFTVRRALNKIRDLSFTLSIWRRNRYF